MFVRSAYFFGLPRPGQEAALRERLLGAVKMYLAFENIRAAQLMEAKEAEHGAPNLYATLQLRFDNEHDLQAALATPYRQQLRSHFLENVFPLFDGYVKHINHELQEMVAAG